MNTFFVAFIALLLASCASERQNKNLRGAPASQSEARPTVYLDVRTPEEYAEEHIAGAINIPYDQIAERHTELASVRDSSLVVYCASGRRSAIALDVLQRNGFSRVVNGGGIDDLEAQGVPAER